MVKNVLLRQAKEATLENLRSIQQTLTACVEEGMVDTGDAYYNEILDLLEDTRILTSWDELDEIITLAKTLEVDVAAWLSFHGRTTISLPSPNPPK